LVVLAFQLVGLGMLALFFGAMVSNRQTLSR